MRGESGDGAGAGMSGGVLRVSGRAGHGLGGSTKHAYQASKAEQDRLAARLWNGGAGARNWDCAELVGIVTGSVSRGASVVVVSTVGFDDDGFDAC